MCVLIIVFFFKQKMADEMRISDWSSDVGSSEADRAGSLPEPCGIGSPTDPHGNAAMSIKEAQAELLKLVRAELAQPVADDVRSPARAVAQRHGRASIAVLFYGSCLRESDVPGLMRDFYLIVADYGRAYGSRWMAWANRLGPIGRGSWRERVGEEV